MRKSHLFNATALGLITASGLVFTAQAQAETTISTARTTPALTATIKDGGADDIKITSTGSIALDSGTALTINSNHKAVIEGAITIAKPADNATGVLIDGARTTDLNLTGSISITDDYTPSDQDDPKDGLIDGDFAKGTNRYGIRATDRLTGKFEVGSAGKITVEGNQSAGISLENGQTGDFKFDGSLAATGTDITGIRLAGDRTGNTYVSGNITTQGPSASALDISGTQTGSLIIDSTIGNTGYRYPNGVSDDLLKKLKAENLQQGKAAVSISGDVTKGILINGAVTDTDSKADPDDRNNDENGNGLIDSTESTATIAQYGSAPALLIGSDTQDITIGAVTYNENAIDTYKDQTYGLVNRGAISANGVYSGVGATGIQVGGLGHTVTLENGIYSSGAVTAAALDADAHAAALLDGTRADTFINAGSLSAGVSSEDGANAAYALYVGSGADVPAVKNSGTLGSKTAGDKTKAYGLYIGSGAQVGALDNSGEISVQATGKDAEAVAIYDGSNSLTSLTNTKFITAAISGGTDSEGKAQTATNRSIAIDTRTNTAGLTLTQTDTSTEEVSNIPYIIGDVLLGSGNDVLKINGGYVLGTLDFGAGQNSLTIDKGGRVGGIIKGTGTIALDIIDGRMELGRGTAATLSQLHVGKDGALRFNLNTETPTQAVLTTNGTATFDDGAKIELGLDKIVRNSTRYTLLKASDLSFGTVNVENYNQSLPYLYKSTLSTDAGTLYADVRLRTQAESGLSANEYGAFDAVLTAAQGSTAASNALLAPSTEASFLNAYMSFLPDFSGENILTLAKGNEALSRTLFAQSVVPSAGENQYWLQEYGYQITRDRGDTAGFEARGFSFAGGVERGLSSTQAVGLFLGYTAASPTDSFATPEEDLSATDLSLGLYWRIDNGDGFKGWARGGVGRASFESERHILETNYIATGTSKWNGVSYNASAGASYEFDAGFLSITPSVSADYYGLKEDAHAETGGDSAFDLSVDERNSHLFSGSALLNIGRANKDALFKPELWVGYRNNFSVELADTVARFEGGNPFTLTGGEVEGGGPVAGLRIAASNEYSYFGLEAEYEKQDAYENTSLAIRVRFQF